MNDKEAEGWGHGSASSVFALCVEGPELPPQYLCKILNVMQRSFILRKTARQTGGKDRWTPNAFCQLV